MSHFQLSVNALLAQSKNKNKGEKKRIIPTLKYLCFLLLKIKGKEGRIILF